MPTDRPVVFLAFADARSDLSSLRVEGWSLKDQFDEPKRRGVIADVVVEEKASLERIYSVFQNYRDRIALFHFGGHADRDRLLFQSAFEPRPAYAEGLATLLGQQRGLKLVFLNGCSTRPQVKRLLNAGVPAVIATARPINDQVATEFAKAFYQALTTGYRNDNRQVTGGCSLAAAFEQAQGMIKAACGGNPRDFVTATPSYEEVTDEDGFPWEVQYRKGSDHIERWNLFEDDPLFGLPDLPSDIGWPVEPYRNLEYFQRDHARIFFGRGRAIRELYNLLTLPAEAAESRLLFYYGQTGVGKTSVLAAGLLPRVETLFATRYCRRSAQDGLLGTLRDELAPGAKPFDLGSACLKIEHEAQRPLAIVLDQAEEAFTKPLVGLRPKDELRELFEAVYQAFAPTRPERPRGRLILSFRKEWLAEFNEIRKALNLDIKPKMLDPLDRPGVIEAIEGPAKHFGLEIKPDRDHVKPGEATLAEYMSHDMFDTLADPQTEQESPIAPTLQILLARMWKEANDPKRLRGQPTFDRAFYQELKGKGFKLDEVIQEQFSKIAEIEGLREAVEKGLLLDLLEFFTTHEGTADTHTRQQIHDRYKHQPAERLDALLEGCQNRYLLAHVGVGADGTAAYRLTHDTLAPLLRERFRVSPELAQRARHLIEGRAATWTSQPTDPVLDRVDLGFVEAGLPWMRAVEKDEPALLEASHRAEERRVAEEEERQRELRESREREEQTRRDKEQETKLRLKEQQETNRRLRQRAYVLLAALAATIVFAALAVWQWGKSKKSAAEANTQTEIAKEQTKKAKKSAEEAQAQTGIAREQTKKAEAESRIAESRRLVAEARSSLGSGHPQQALILAVEAVKATRDLGEPIVPATETTLREVLGYVGGTSISWHGGSIQALGFAPDGRLVTAGDDKTARVWDLQNPAAEPLVLRGHENSIVALKFAADGRLVTASSDTTARVWDLQNPAAQPLVLRGHSGGIRVLGFAPDGRLVTAGMEPTVRVWDLQNPAAQPLVLRGNELPIYALGFAPDGRLVTAGHDYKARVWDLQNPAAEPLVLRGHVGPIEALGFAPDGRLVTAGWDKTARVWDLQNPAAEPLVLRGHEDRILALGFAPDGRLVTAGWDKTARVWDLQNPAAEPLVLRGHEDRILALGFAPDGRMITAGNDRTARMWDLQNPAAEPLVLRGHEDSIVALGFTPDGRLVTASDDTTARVWDLKSLGAEPLVLRGHEGWIQVLGFAPDGRLVTGSSDGTARVWDLKSPGAEPLVLRGHKTAIEALGFAPDGRLVTAGDRTARVWDLQNPAAEPLVLRGHEGVIVALGFAPDGRLVTAGMDRTARVWDLQNPAAEPLVLRGHKSTILALGFAPDGRLVTAGKDKTARVWDLQNPAAEPLVLRGHEGWIQVLGFAPDGRLVTAGDDKTARVWDLHNPAAEPLVLRGHRNPIVELGGGILALGFAPDGRLVTAGDDKTARVWDLKNPAAEPLVLWGHEDRIVALGFTPDGRLVTAGKDKTARVWDLHNPAAEPLVLRGHKGPIKALMFAPDGRLVTASGDTTARVWDLSVPRLISQAKIVAGRDLTPDEWQRYFPGRPYRRTFP